MTPRPPIRARAPLALAVACGLALTVGVPVARAHNQSFAISGDNVLVRTDQGPGTEAFSFGSSDAGSIPVNHDPSTEGAAVLVRGVGASAGRTPLISLDPQAWTPTATGYQYSDPTGARGGITGVLFQPGQLQLAGGGASWGWSPSGPQDAVWVHFRVQDEWYCAEFSTASANVVANQAGHFEATAAPSPGLCPEQVCGNGELELGEECDDGNLVEGDGCDNDCTIGACEAPAFSTTWEGIQKIIFESEVYGCTQGACHDSILPQGNLDLSGPQAYENLLGPDGQGAPASSGPFKRVEPVEPSQSLLYLKLLASKPGYDGPNVGSPMPVGTVPLSDEHLEAIRLWIRGGAPQDLVVEGTASLLGTCLPESDPLKAPIPDPPPQEAGFQLRQPPWNLLGVVNGQGEDEICTTIYYDLSARLPEGAAVPCNETYEFRKACSGDRTRTCNQDSDCAGAGVCVPAKNVDNPDGECLAYDHLKLVQDPQSHHSIIGVYTGQSDWTDPKWGAWTYKFEPDDPRSSMNGQPCDPTAIDPTLGYNPGCSSEIFSAVACIGYGPDDLGNLNLVGGGGNLPQISLAQEPFFEFTYPEGVYNEMPVRGLLVWNSHAFNLSKTDTTMAEYLNVEYAPAQERVYPSQQIFDARWIFGQFIHPFEKKEVCATYTLPQGSRLFQISSHTHRHGIKWRTWAPPNSPCQPQCPTAQDDPPLGLLDTFGICPAEPFMPLCSGPRQDEPMYFSSEYSDPLYLQIDPPMAFDSPNVEDRTFLYCSVYDNGSTPTSPPVKQQSTSPEAPDLFGGLGPLAEVVGGPCLDYTVACLNQGPNQGMLCGDADGVGKDDTLCDSAPGAGDGVCDACPVHGGVTTEDEMFILLGNYFLAPEPSAGALGAAAFASLLGLAHRRRGAGRARYSE
jgi:cysteine-rich repeat protein